MMTYIIEFYVHHEDSVEFKQVLTRALQSFSLTMKRLLAAFLASVTAVQVGDAGLPPQLRASGSGGLEFQGILNLGVGEPTEHTIH